MPLPGQTNYPLWAGLGAGAGAAGSLAGDLFGGLDAPRRWLWETVPGLHDPETGEAYTGAKVAEQFLHDFGKAERPEDESALRPLLAGAGGLALQTLLDPLTLAAGPLGGIVGGRGALAAGRAGAANRAGRLAAESAPTLEAAAAQAGEAAAAVPDYSTILGRYPTEVVRDALSTGKLGGLRGYGGVRGIGTLVQRPPSSFLLDQLERQGFGSAVLDDAGQLTDKMLLAGDPATRALFAPRGGRLQQLAEVDPAARGPLAPLFEAQPEAPPLRDVFGAEGLDDLYSGNPLLREMVGNTYANLGGAPASSVAKATVGMRADEGAGVLAEAAARTREGAASLQDRMRKSVIDRLFARYLTGNTLGV